MPSTCEHLGGDLFSKELPFANIERVFKPLIFCTVWSLFSALIGWKRWHAGWAGLAVCHRGQHKLMHKSINARFKVSTKMQKTHTHTHGENAKCSIILSCRGSQTRKFLAPAWSLQNTTDLFVLLWHTAKLFPFCPSIWTNCLCFDYCNPLNRCSVKKLQYNYLLSFLKVSELLIPFKSARPVIHPNTGSRFCSEF